MTDELMRRIQDALDTDEGIDGDPGLKAEIDASPAVRRLADELRRVDEALRSLPSEEGTVEFWEGMAERVNARLDESLDDLSDPSAAPIFEEEEGPEDVSQLSAVRLARSRRNEPREGSGWAFGGFAVAAVALLAAIGTTVTMMGREPSVMVNGPSYMVVPPGESEAASEPLPQVVAMEEPAQAEPVQAELMAKAVAAGRAEGAQRSAAPELAVDGPPATGDPLAEQGGPSTSTRRRAVHAPSPRAAREDESRRTARELTQALVGARSAIKECIDRHHVTTADGMIRLHFDVHPDGRVRAARVRPQSLHQSPGAECILGVARRTRFPAQGSARNFSIPIRVANQDVGTPQVDP